MNLVTGTLAFNVPVGFSMQLEALRKSTDLKKRFFADLDMVFYAGASLPQDIWDGFSAMAKEVRGEVPLMTSSWGLTETAPACLLQHQRVDRSGIVGVPLPGVATKLLPQGDGRFEIRVKGPNVTSGYFRNPAKTEEAFDEEGYFVTGDAMRFVDDDDPNRGLAFAGRIAEDFKLLSGTWVRAANLRLDLLARLAPIASDLVITGEDRGEIGLLIFPTVDAAKDADDDGGALVCKTLAADIAKRLGAPGRTASSTRIGRALVLAEPPSIADAEITAKGNLNFRRVLERRADLLARLYDDNDRAVIHPETAA
jgi:feruloyl-CoA synthase